MRNKYIGVLISIVLIVGAYYAGYQIGSHRSSPFNAPSGAPTLYSQWIVANKPPLPIIHINKLDIRVYRGSYSWSQSTGGNSVEAVSVDAVAPTLMKSTVVPAGSLIESKAPSRVKKFTIVNTTKGFQGDPYSSTVPDLKGVYTYRVECEWFLDQGQADYFFSIQVKP